MEAEIALSLDEIAGRLNSIEQLIARQLPKGRATLETLIQAIRTTASIAKELRKRKKGADTFLAEGYLEYLRPIHSLVGCAVEDKPQETAKNRLTIGV